MKKLLFLVIILCLFFLQFFTFASVIEIDRLLELVDISINDEANVVSTASPWNIGVKIKNIEPSNIKNCYIVFYTNIIIKHNSSIYDTSRIAI